MASLAQRSDFIRRSAKSGNWLRAVFALRNELCTQPWRPAEVAAAASSNSAQSSSSSVGGSTLPSALELFQQHIRSRRHISNDEHANLKAPNASSTGREEDFSRGRSLGEVSSFQTSSLSSSTWAQTNPNGGLSAALAIGFGLDSIDCTTVNIANESSVHFAHTNAIDSSPTRRPASAKEKRDALELLIVGCEALLPVFMGTTPEAKFGALRKVIPADADERGDFQKSMNSSQKEPPQTFSPLAALYLLSAADKGRVLHALPSSLLHEALFNFVIPLLERARAGEGKRSEESGSTSKQMIVLAENLVFPLFKSFAVSISRNSRGARTFANDVFQNLEKGEMCQAENSRGENRENKGKASLGSHDNCNSNFIFESIAVDCCGEVVDIEQFDVISSVATLLLKKAQASVRKEGQPLFSLSPEDYMVLFAFSLGSEAFSKLMLNKYNSRLAMNDSASASWGDLFARNRAFVSFAIREGTLVPFLASCWSHHHRNVSFSSTLRTDNNGVDTCAKGLQCVRGRTFSTEIIKTLREILSDLAMHSPVTNDKRLSEDKEDLYMKHSTHVEVVEAIALCMRYCPRRALGKDGPLGLLKETERLSKALVLGNEQAATMGERSESLVTVDFQVDFQVERETSKKQTELRHPYPSDLMPQFVLAASRCRVEYIRRATLSLRRRRSSRSCGERWRVLCELASDMFLFNELILIGEADRVTDILRQQRTALIASSVFASYAPLSGAALRMMLDAPVKGLSTHNIFVDTESPPKLISATKTSDRRHDKTQQDDPNIDEDHIEMGLIYKTAQTQCSTGNNALSTTFIAASKNKKVSEVEYGDGAVGITLPTLPDPRWLSPEELTLRAVFGSLATEVALYSYLHLPSAANNCGGPSHLTDEEVTTRVINSFSDAEVVAYNKAVLRELLDRLGVDERSSSHSRARGVNSTTSFCSSTSNSEKRLSYEALSFLLRMLRASSVLNNSMVRAFAANGHSGVACASLALPTPREDTAWRIAHACFTQLTAHFAAKGSEKKTSVVEEDAGGREGDVEQVEIAIYSMSVLTIALLARAPATAIGDSAVATESSIQRISLSHNEETHEKVDPFSLQLLMRSCVEVLEAFRERKDREQNKEALVVEALRKVVGVIALVTQASVKKKIIESNGSSNSGKVILPKLVALLDEVTVSYGLK